MYLPPYKTFPELAIGDDIALCELMPNQEIDDVVDLSYYDGEKAATKDDALVLLHKIKEDYTKGDSIHWGIKDTRNGEVVGACGFYRGFNNETGELGYLLREPYHGKSIMANALQAVIKFGFTVMNLKKLRVVTHAKNTHTQSLLKKLRFKKERKLDNDALEFILHRSSF
ncbi:MAG: GNAT family N-acetyltransferase [Filimonas sp.]|nr:GNAT family N-acetyltransferase [Filimonas sp.]